MSAIANPEVLVSTDWLSEHLSDPKIRVIEISVDSKLFAAGHIPGAVDLNWTTQLQDQVRRDIVSSEGFGQLLSAVGITKDHTVVLYGDHSNWFAAYAFWLFKLYGHADVRLLNGGRAKWLNESNRPLTTDLIGYPRSSYKASPRITRFGRSCRRCCRRPPHARRI